MPDSRQWSVHTENKLGWILMYSLVCLIFNASPLCEQPGAAGGSEDMKALHRQSSQQNKSSAHQKCSLNRQQAIKCRIRSMRSPELHICNTLHQYVYDCIKKKGIKWQKGVSEAQWIITSCFYQTCGGCKAKALSGCCCKKVSIKPVL